MSVFVYYRLPHISAERSDEHDSYPDTHSGGHSHTKRERGHETERVIKRDRERERERENEREREREREEVKVSMKYKHLLSVVSIKSSIRRLCS